MRNLKVTGTTMLRFMDKDKKSAVSAVRTEVARMLRADPEYDRRLGECQTKQEVDSLFEEFCQKKGIRM